MSRAFVRESDSPNAGEDVWDRPQSSHTNYVTPVGLEQLQAQVRTLSAERDALGQTDDLAARQRLAQVRRDLTYFEDRLERAILVSPVDQADATVRFGSVVDVAEVDGSHSRFAIVGEDEADVTQGKISWVSPLAKALLNAQVGDWVTWSRPAGNKDLEIIAIRKA